DIHSSPAETSSTSALDELAESTDSTSSVPPGWYKRTACDAALASIKEEKDFQESSGEANDFLSLGFSKKLWKTVEGPQLKSIWWVDDGICVAVDEERSAGEEGTLKSF
uniref:Uncharacterized protein n=1 Tax=Bubo bubo TaxID=30461 RepID=A0A8C0ESY6_BUBBB